VVVIWKTYNILLILFSSISYKPKRNRTPFISNLLRFGDDVRVAAMMLSTPVKVAGV
jgi:hypothetical protein